MAKEQDKSSTATEQVTQKQDTQKQANAESSAERGVARRQGGQQPAMLASPFTFMRRFMDDLDQLFSLGLGASGTPAAASRAPNGGQSVWFPAVEVLERDGKLVVRADVPGMSADQINVAFEDGHLVISGERREEKDDRQGGTYRSEVTYGSFYRVIPLPEGVDPEQAKASFSNGVLEITMPAPQRPQARQIQVQEGQEAKQAAHQSADAKHGQQTAA